MELVVGRIGRAHGVRGEVSVDVRTDDVERRYAEGSVLGRADGEPLTVVRARWHSGRMLVQFAGIEDRESAQALRGTLLVVDSATAGEPPEGEWWDHDIVGLDAVLGDDRVLGIVTEVVHLPGGDLLAVRAADGAEVLIPFATDIVPEVDVAGGRVVVTPPDGLLTLDQAPSAP
ncbi:MAG: ribosome maturation factor RimM [Mycobacteriales bacterium]